MPLDLTTTTVENILTRTTGYLTTVASHSLQPYRGCTFGKSLCGAGCYVRHNAHVLRGRTWGEFLEVRTNAVESYRRHYPRESAWARRARGAFSIYCSSVTDPFLPQERRYRLTAGLLAEMLELPPDLLILQTHSHHVLDQSELIAELSRRGRVRVHISIETDRASLPGLPPHASSIDDRLQACEQLRRLGVFIVVTVSPLLPIEAPERFFGRIAEVADAVVIDHFIGGDGSPNGSRTRRTLLPEAMRAIDPGSLSLDYRDQMLAAARRCMPGRVGCSIEGFAGRYS